MCVQLDLIGKVLSATVLFVLLYCARAYLQTIVMGTGGFKLGGDSNRGS